MMFIHPKKIRNKKRFRWIIIPLLIIIILLAVGHEQIWEKAEIKKDALIRIRERGQLIALTDQNSLNYFIYRGEAQGYQLEMLQSFARHLGVPLKIIALNDIGKLNYYLQYHAADLIALQLPVSSAGKKSVHFSDPFGETRLVLVQRKQSGDNPKSNSFITSIDDFSADTVYICENPFTLTFYRYFQKSTHKKVVLISRRDLSQENLIRQVAEGKIDYALCHENIAMVCKRFYSNINTSLVVTPIFSCSWAVNHQSDSLLQEINLWLKKFKAKKENQKIYQNYFNNQRIASFFKSDFFSVTGSRISPFDNEIRKYSQWIGWDWRLLASLIYEESNFRTGLVSSRNASGLMQLMPEIAAKFGMDSISGPAQQIAAGVKYIKYLDKQLPDEITDRRERIFFVLASYNVGIGRILSAREKAGKYGKNMNRWNGHVDYYLLRRSKKDPYGKPDSLDIFPIDYKTEGFVDDIVTRFYHYRNLIK